MGGGRSRRPGRVASLGVGWSRDVHVRVEEGRMNVRRMGWFRNRPVRPLGSLHETGKHRSRRWYRRTRGLRPLACVHTRHGPCACGKCGSPPSISPHLCHSPSLPISVTLHLCLSLSVSVCLCLSLCVSVSPHLCHSPSLPVSISACLCVSLSLSISVSLHLCLSPSLSLSISVSPHLSQSLPVWLSRMDLPPWGSHPTPLELGERREGKGGDRPETNPFRKGRVPSGTPGSLPLGMKRKGRRVQADTPQPQVEEGEGQPGTCGVCLAPSEGVSGRTTNRGTRRCARIEHVDDAVRGRRKSGGNATLVAEQTRGMGLGDLQHDRILVRGRKIDSRMKGTPNTGRTGPKNNDGTKRADPPPRTIVHARTASKP